MLFVRELLHHVMLLCCYFAAVLPLLLCEK